MAALPKRALQLSGARGRGTQRRPAAPAAERVYVRRPGPARQCHRARLVFETFVAWRKENKMPDVVPFLTYEDGIAALCR